MFSIAAPILWHIIESNRSAYKKNNDAEKGFLRQGIPVQNGDLSTAISRLDLADCQICKEVT